MTAVETPPVVAAFDGVGHWHDDGNGQFAKEGWSTAKRAIVALLHDHTTRDAAHRNPDGVHLTLRPGTHLRTVIGAGPHLTRFHDDQHGAVTIGNPPRRVLVAWDQFEPPTPTIDTPTVQHMDAAVLDRPVRDDLGFVTDRTVPWEHRVARLAQERDRVIADMGPPEHWWRLPDPFMLHKVWDAKAGMDPMPDDAVAAFAALDRVEAFGAAVTELVKERAAELGSTGGTARRYTPEAGTAIADAVERYLASDQEWISRGGAADVFPTMLDRVRAGKANVVVKPTKVLVLFTDDQGRSALVTVEKANYVGDHALRYRDKAGHVHVKIGGDKFGDPYAAHRGNGDFTETRKAIKAALDKSTKQLAPTLVTPPSLQAWIDTMETMGVDMSVDPNVQIGFGMPPTDEYNGGLDYERLGEVPFTAYSEVKASSVGGKTVAAGLAPYPRDWTALLPRQQINVSNKMSARVGNASNAQFPDGDGAYLTVASVATNPQNASAVAHEFGHSMQRAIPGLYQGEMWHMISRLADHPDEATSQAGYGEGTTVFRDSFTSDYSGRVYFTRPDVTSTGFVTAKPADAKSDAEQLTTVRAFELFTTGVQTLYSTDRRGGLDSDPRLTAFTTGMMALVRDPNAMPRKTVARPVAEPLPPRPGVPYLGLPDKQAVIVGRMYQSSDEYQHRLDVAPGVMQRLGDEAATPTVVRSSGVFADIVQRGSFRNWIETMRPQEAKTRASQEHAYMGVPLDTPPESRPVYGTVLTGPGLAAAMAPDWGRPGGDVIFIVNPTRVKGRVTVSNGDPLYGSVAPIFPDRIPGATPQRLAAAYHDSAGDTARTQIHGGLTLNDIDRIVVPANSTLDYRGILDRNGYPHVHVDTYPVVDGQPDLSGVVPDVPTVQEMASHPALDNPVFARPTDANFTPDELAAFRDPAMFTEPDGSTIGASWYEKDTTTLFRLFMGDRRRIADTMKAENPQPSRVKALQAAHRLWTDNVKKPMVLSRGTDSKDPFAGNEPSRWGSPNRRDETPTSGITSWSALPKDRNINPDERKPWGKHQVQKSFKPGQVLGVAPEVDGEVLVARDPLIVKAIMAWPNPIDGVPTAPFNTFPERHAAATPTVQEMTTAVTTPAREATDHLAERYTPDAVAAGIAQRAVTSPALVRAALSWQAISQTVREAAVFASTPDLPKVPSDTPDLLAAEALINAAADAAPVDRTLYRGLVLDDVPKVGGTISDPLGAWSVNHDVAMFVGNLRKKNHPGGHIVMLEVDGALAAPISHLASLNTTGDGYRVPHVAAAGEYVASGTYRVTGMRKEQRNGDISGFADVLATGTFPSTDPHAGTPVNVTVLTVTQDTVNRFRVSEDGTVWWPNARLVPEPADPNTPVVQEMAARPVVLGDAGLDLASTAIVNGVATRTGGGHYDVENGKRTWVPDSVSP